MNFFKWWKRSKELPKVTILAIDREQVILGSNQPLSVGKGVTVRAELPNSPPRNLKVLPYYVRPAGKESFVCVGLADRDLGETTRPGDQAEWGFRRGARLRCSLRALCQHLPGYQGVVLDFTPRGVKLKAQGVVPVGTTLRLRIETDFQQTPAFECVGEVCWCQQSKRKTALMGIRFKVPQEAMADEELKKLEAVLQWREHASFMESVLTVEPVA